MKFFAALFGATLMTTTLAVAQPIPHGDGPGGVPFGAGTQRGLQALNNSGQTGFVTLFNRGARTGVVVQVDSTHGRVERAIIVRGNSCDTISNTVAAELEDLHGGISRTFVPMTQAKLLSGNYLTVVMSNTGPGARPVSCGELYQ
jgi:hypothetical protein